MYARLVTFSLKPGGRPEAEKGADEFAKLCRTLKGFNSLTLLINEEANEYGGLSLWQTKQDADAAMVKLDANLREHLSSRLVGKPVVGMFEVYESKAEAQATHR